MKKRISVFIACFLLICVAITPLTVSASESTSYTYTLSVNGGWIRTQDAYMPGSMFLNNGTLSAPEDIFVKDGKLYIADTGNGRLVIYDITGGTYTTIGEGTLVAPCGLYVTENAIFVADREAKTVFKFGFDGAVLLKLTRPDSYLFSKQSQYIPKNVAVTSQGVIFVCGEGAYEGLMQFDSAGVFQGYYAANSTKMTFLDRLQELIFTEEQLQSITTRTPNPIFNLDISDRDLVYSITQLEATTLWSVASKSENAVKYHNMAGKDILSTELIEDEHNFTDIVAYKNGLSFAVTSSGIIYEYDDAGNVIFSFGGKSYSERLGHFVYANAIDVDNEGMLYILDKERAFIQTFFPTDFAVSTHQALYNLSNGSYKESENTWLELLRLNGMSLIAHQGYGKVLYQQQRFTEAAEQFKITGDKENYSECIWELRNLWFQKNLAYIIIILVLVVAFYYIQKIVRKKKKKIYSSDAPKNKFSAVIKREWSYLRGMLKSPVDEFYYLKHNQHGSVLSATVIYILVFGFYLADMLLRSFTFSLIDTEKVYPISIVILFLVPAILWVLGNTMVSAINEGEGSFKNIYIATAYSLTPYLLLAPITVIATYIFTLNETVIVMLLWVVAIAWSALLLCMSVKETHNYNLKETIKVILLTLFFMIMAIVVCVIIFLIIQQLVDFFKDIANEVVYRVQS